MSFFYKHSLQRVHGGCKAMNHTLPYDSCPCYTPFSSVLNIPIYDPIIEFISPIVELVAGRYNPTVSVSQGGTIYPLRLLHRTNPI